MKDATKNAGSVISKYACRCSDLMPHHLFTTNVTLLPLSSVLHICMQQTLLYK